MQVVLNCRDSAHQPRVIQRKAKIGIQRKQFKETRTANKKMFVIFFLKIVINLHYSDKASCRKSQAPLAYSFCNSVQYIFHFVIIPSQCSVHLTLLDFEGYFEVFVFHILTSYLHSTHP